MPSPPTEDAWSRTLDAFDAAQQELIAAVSRSDSRRLDELVGGGRSPEAGTGVSWYVMLHGVSQHDAYHAGQMALLRKLARG
ncbi:MAG: hypothetical protein ACREOF_02500 [Gemmatimonadales bacterium]